MKPLHGLMVRGVFDLESLRPDGLTITYPRPFGTEPFSLELRVERLTKGQRWLPGNGVNACGVY